MGFTVNQPKLKHLQNTIKVMGDRTKDYKKPLRTSAEILILEARDNIQKQGFHYGTFEPLATSTKIDRARKGYEAARPILIRTEKLMMGFIQTGLRNTSVKVQNQMSYSGYHQTGTRKMPARIILAVTDKRRKAIQQLFANFMMK